MSDKVNSGSGVKAPMMDKVDVKSITNMDKIAKVVISRYNHSVEFRNSTRYGDKGLYRVMVDCYNQKNGIYSARDKEVVDNIGVDYYVNITDLKSSALEAVMKGILLDGNDKAFTVLPTPMPDLPYPLKLAAVRELIATSSAKELSEPHTINSKLSMIKDKYTRIQENMAEKASSAMDKLMSDQCVEGGYKQAMSDFIRDFTVYPFACIEGPVSVVEPRPYWDGKKLKTKNQIKYEFRRVSPFDVVWTSDSTTLYDGTGVTIRGRMTRYALAQAKGMASYVDYNIDEVINSSYRDRSFSLWTVDNPERANSMFNSVYGGDDVETLTHYGRFLGQDLLDYGVTTKKTIDPELYYEAKVVIVKGYLIQFALSGTDGLYSRPVHAASYETTGDGIAGISIAQKVRDVERAYLATLRFALKNGAMSSMPIGEADFRSLVDNQDAVDSVEIIPGVIRYVNRAPGSSSAYSFHTIPNNSLAYMAMMDKYMSLADRITQLPASLHGEPIGTGANRTFRGMAMLNSNILKTIQAGIANLDATVHKPLGTLLYNFNLTYGEASSIKGDCKVDPVGVSGLLAKEVEKQNALELLQTLVSVGINGQNGNVGLNWALAKVYKTMGMPDDIVQQVLAEPDPPAEAQQAGVQSQGDQQQAAQAMAGGQ